MTHNVILYKSATQGTINKELKAGLTKDLTGFKNLSGLQLSQKPHCHTAIHI